MFIHLPAYVCTPQGRRSFIFIAAAEALPAIIIITIIKTLFPQVSKLTCRLAATTTRKSLYSSIIITAGKQQYLN